MSEREEIAKEIIKSYSAADEFIGSVPPFVTMDILTVADWHIAEIAKAKQEGRKEAIKEMKLLMPGYFDDSIINEGGK